MNLEFVHLGDRGTVSVYVVANDDPARLGKGEEARGFPVCSASIDFEGRGYRALMGWVQLVRSTDNGSRGVDFEMDPARFFEDSPAPFCWWGFAPSLFDAPSRDTREQMDWMAHSFLAFVPRDQGDVKEATPLLGFSWGFRIDDSGRIALTGVEPLSASDWNAHSALLTATYPTWRFTSVDSFH